MKLAFGSVPENKDALLGGRPEGHRRQPEVAPTGQNSDKLRPI